LFLADRRYDGQIDMLKVIVDLRNFANAHKNGCVLWYERVPNNNFIYNF
jgi:hypothetical protein